MDKIHYITYNKLFGQTAIDRSEKVSDALSKVSKAMHLGHAQKVIPAVASTLSSDFAKTMGSSLFIVSSVLGSVIYGLNLLQKTRFIDGLHCLQTNKFPSEKHKKAFIKLIKKSGNLSKILSPEFCKTKNIHSQLFLDKGGNLKPINKTTLCLMMQQAKRKRVMDGIGLVISVLSLAIFLASLATPIPIWVVYFLPSLLFTTTYILEKQFIDNNAFSLSHFLPDFIKNMQNAQDLIKIEDLAAYFEKNRARFGLYLTDEEGKELDKRMAEIKRGRIDNGYYHVQEAAKEEFSKHLRKILKAKVTKDKIEMAGLGFLGVGGALALLPSPALLGAILPLVGIGLVLKFKPSWFLSTRVENKPQSKDSLAAQKAAASVINTASNL